MPSVFEVLERLREASIDEYDKGKRFELTRIMEIPQRRSSKFPTL